MCVRVSDERVAAVVRHVEPFVPVGGPGVGARGASQEVSVAWRGRGPQPEGAIDVNPRSGRAGEWNQGGEVVESPHVQIACLEQHDGRRVALGQRRGERFRPEFRQYLNRPAPESHEPHRPLK